MGVKRRPIYWAFISSVIIIVISALSIIYGLFLAKNLQVKVAKKQLQTVVSKIVMENGLELSSLSQTLNVARNLIKVGLLQTENQELLTKKVFALIEGNNQIHALSIISSSGPCFSLIKKNGGCESYYIENDTIKQKNVLSWDSISGFTYQGKTILVNSVIPIIDKDNLWDSPVDSIISNTMHLIPGSQRDYGISYSLRVKDVSNNWEYIIIVHMSIDHIYYYLNNKIARGESQVSFILKNGKMFNTIKGTNDTINPLVKSEYWIHWDSAHGTPLYEAILKWEQISEQDSTNIFCFHYNRQMYCAAFKLTKIPKTKVWMVYITPVKDLSHVIVHELKTFFVIICLIFVFSIIISIVFYGMYKKELGQLSELTDRELLNLIKKGESDAVEFKSTVRMNLHTNKPGKEIELAWLKSLVAFCNTSGGRIFIGVSDSGQLLGLEVDDFVSDDKLLLHVQNLIRQYVGLEFTSYINYQIRILADVKVLVVRCQVAPKPVFLRANNKEQFFVRSGPSSIELPVSKALAYINDKGKL